MKGEGEAGGVTDKHQVRLRVNGTEHELLVEARRTLADMLRLGAAHGLSLALARRVRSLVWGAVGIALVAARAARLRP